MLKKILIVGGTQEGNKLAEVFHHHKYDYTISYAGIVNKVHEKEFSKRIGGFGGKNGIIDYVKKNKITHIIDASHPFSKKISFNTFSACKTLDLPLIHFSRKPWYKSKKDNWIRVKSFQESTNYLKSASKKIFLAIGKKNLEIYKNFSHHFFLLRLLENKNNIRFFPNQECIVSEGPFHVEEDIKILKKYNIDMIITKNSGGNGAYSKIIAARELGITVIIISRPRGAKVKKVYNFDSILKWLNHESLNLGV